MELSAVFGRSSSPTSRAFFALHSAAWALCFCGSLGVDRQRLPLALRRHPCRGGHLCGRVVRVLPRAGGHLCLPHCVLACMQGGPHLSFLLHCILVPVYQPNGMTCSSVVSLTHFSLLRWCCCHRSKDTRVGCCHGTLTRPSHSCFVRVSSDLRLALYAVGGARVQREELRRWLPTWALSPGPVLFRHGGGDLVGLPGSLGSPL